VVLEVVLVVALGGIEALERDDFGDDGLRIDFGRVELRDVGLSDLLLLIVGIEDRGAVLRAVVGALVVEFSGIVADGEEDHEDLAVGNLGWIEDDFDRLGVAGFPGADFLVVCGFGGAAGIAGGRGGDALYVSEDGLNAPEAAACYDRGFF